MLFLSWLHCFPFAALDSFLPPSIWFWHKTVRKSTIDFTVSCQEKHWFCLWTIRKSIVFFFNSELSEKALVLTLNHLEKQWFWLWTIWKSTGFGSDLSGKALVLTLSRIAQVSTFNCQTMERFPLILNCRWFFLLRVKNCSILVVPKLWRSSCHKK